MLTGKEDLLRSLIEAFLMEKGTQEFYAEASEKAMDPEAKKTFRELRDWEEKHVDYIGFLYQSILDDRAFGTFDEFREMAPAPITEGGIPVKDLESRMEAHTFIDDMGTLSLALEIEGKAYNLYRGMSEKASDTNARVVFSNMMEQEMKHIDYIREMRTKLAKAS